MTEETTEQTTEPTTEPTPELTEPQTGNWREQPGAKAMVGQIAELRSQLEAIEATKKAAEQKQLEEQGEWKVIAENAKKEKEALIAIHAKDLTLKTLESELIKARLTEDYARAGVIAGYDGDADGVSEYVATVVRDNPALFKEPGMPPATTPAQGGASAGGSTGGRLSPAQLKAVNDQSPRELQKQAYQQKEAYFAEHGTFDGMYG